MSLSTTAIATTAATTVTPVVPPHYVELNEPKIGADTIASIAAVSALVITRADGSTISVDPSVTVASLLAQNSVLTITPPATVQATLTSGAVVQVPFLTGAVGAGVLSQPGDYVLWDSETGAPPAVAVAGVSFFPAASLSAKYTLVS